jgi:uncharacterized protein YlxP (DUF503 family)
MIVGVCRITLLIDASHSLKEKRMVLRRIKDRVRQKFNCAIAEVGDQDAWQSAQLGFSVVSNETGHAQAMVQKVLAFVEALAVAKVADDEQDYVNYGDELIASGEVAHWEPPGRDGDE